MIYKTSYIENLDKILKTEYSHYDQIMKVSIHSITNRCLDSDLLFIDYNREEVLSNNRYHYTKAEEGTLASVMLEKIHNEFKNKLKGLKST